MYQARQFAELAGVTVRTLHHYDRVGLLRPKRNAAGYRLYRDRDLERLEQIVALKNLGLPLKQIQVVLNRDRLGLVEALRAQRRVLEQKRRLLNRAITAIRSAEIEAAAGRGPDAAVLKKLIEVFEMQNDWDFTSKYYSESAIEKIAVRKKEWTPELQEQCTRDWTQLFKDVEAAIAEGVDPASERAKAMAVRWKTLVEGFTKGDYELAAGVKKVWADADNWPEPAKQQAAPFMNKEVWAYMSKVMAC